MSKREPTREEKVCELGIGFHTALRKRCDSFSTTIAYRMVNQLSFGWGWFLEELWKYREEIVKIDREQDPQYPRADFVGVMMMHVFEKIEHKLHMQDHRDEWLDGEAIKKKVKDREIYDLCTFIYTLQEFKREELRGCLAWGGILEEEDA